MAVKRPSLAESMKAVRPEAAPRVIEAPATPAALPSPKAARGGEPKAYFAATRQGMKRINFPADPEDHRRLKRLSADTDRSIEDLMREALRDLFAKLG